MVVLRTLTIAAPVVITVVAKTALISRNHHIICQDDSWCPSGWTCGYKTKAATWEKYGYYMYTCSGPKDTRQQTPPPDPWADFDFDRRSLWPRDYEKHNAELAGYTHFFDVTRTNPLNVAKMCAQYSYFICGVVPKNMGMWTWADILAAERWICEDPVTDCPKPDAERWPKSFYACEDVDGLTKKHKHCVLHIPEMDEFNDLVFDRALGDKVDAVETKGDATLGDKVVVV